MDPKLSFTLELIKLSCAVMVLTLELKLVRLVVVELSCVSIESKIVFTLELRLAVAAVVVASCVLTVPTL